MPESSFTPAHPFRAIIDTSVLVQPRWLVPIVDAARHGFFQPYWSPSIICEANRYLTWRWLERHGGDLSDRAWGDCGRAAKAWFRHVTAAFRVVEDRPPYPSLWAPTPQDADDIPLWTAAVSCQAHAVVTENLQDGPPPDERGLRIWDGVTMLAPADLLPLLDRMADAYVGRALPLLEAEDSDPPPTPDSSAIERLLASLSEQPPRTG